MHSPRTATAGRQGAQREAQVWAVVAQEQGIVGQRRHAQPNLLMKSESREAGTPHFQPAAESGRLGRRPPPAALNQTPPSLNRAPRHAGTATTTCIKPPKTVDCTAQLTWAM